MDTQLCHGVSRVENIPWSWTGQPELHLRQDISRDRTPHGERPSHGDKMFHRNRNLFGERKCIQVRITSGDRMFLRHRTSVWDRVFFGNRTPIHDRTSLGDRIPCSRIRVPPRAGCHFGTEIPLRTDRIASEDKPDALLPE